jgi:type II secretory pathway component GspD/PulD (secretin)/cell division septation protein DedD
MKFARGVCCVLFIVILAAASAPRSIADDRKPAENIAFNFVDVEIPAVIKFISEITGNNFIFDEKVKGKITIIAPAKLSIDESFSLFTSVLNLKGYTIIPTGPKTYKIIPSSQAKEEGKISTGENIPVNEAYITKLIPTQHIKAEDTIQFLRPVVSRDGYIAAFGPGNMLLVVDSAINIEKITSILKLIDQPSAQEEAKINVYFLENADATDLAKVLDSIVKNLQAAYRSQKTNGGRPSDIPPFSIMPDKTTNSLIIIAPPQDYENIVQVVKTLDKRRKQVYVEAMIIEASIDKLRELGSKWRAAATHNGEPIVVGGFGTVNTSTLLSVINGLTGFTAGGMGNFFDVPVTSVSSSGTISTQSLTAPGFAALFSLNDFRDAVNVLSTPQILTSDNEEAEIVVGENVPFISKRERDITTTNTVLSSIERKDVGITLRLTPQITEGDYVKLDIYQEISALKETPESVFTEIGPTTTKRSTKTSVSVKDGHTVVIGGLMQEKEEENVNKMPLLGDIPVMGWLFKSKNLSKNKTNLLVFLSPHIVKESEQLSKITEEKHKEFSDREKLYSPGELMVKFREDVSKERAMEILSQKGASVIKYFEDINVYHIKLRPKQEVDDAIKEFSSLPEVLYAEPNYKIKIDKSPPPADKKEPLAAPDPSSGPNPPLDNGQGSGKRSTENQAGDFDLALVVSDGSADPSLKPRSIGDVIRPTEEQVIVFPEKAPGSESVIAGSDSAETVLKPEQDQGAGNNSPPPDVTADKAPAPPASEVPAAQTSEMKNKEEAVSASADGNSGEDKKMTGSDSAVHEPVVPGKYYIQVGAWRNVRNARNIFEQLKTDYPAAYTVEEGNFTKIKIPGIMSKQQGLLVIKDIKNRFKFKLDPFLRTQKI